MELESGPLSEFKDHAPGNTENRVSGCQCDHCAAIVRFKWQNRRELRALRRSSFAGYSREVNLKQKSPSVSRLTGNSETTLRVLRGEDVLLLSSLTPLGAGPSAVALPAPNCHVGRAAKHKAV